MYVRVKKANMEKVSNVIHQARRYRAVDKFALDCGITPRSLQRYIRDEVKLDYVMDKVWNNIYDHKDMRCKISKDSFFAANGLMEQKYLKAILRDEWERVYTPVPEAVTLCSIDMHGNMYSDTVMSDAEIEEFLTSEDKEADEFILFLEQLAMFGMCLSSTQNKYLYSLRHELYEDMFFCYLLEQWSMTVMVNRDMEQDRMELYYSELEAGSIPDRIPCPADMEFMMMKEYVFNQTKIFKEEEE